jgi:hypothetical protein
MARDNFLKKSDGHSRTPKTFAKLKKSTQILFTINEKNKILQRSKLLNINVSRVKLFIEEQTSNELKNSEKLVV